MFPEPSFICLSEVLVHEPPPGSPTGAPMERVAHFHSLLLHVSRIPHESPPDKKKFTVLSEALGKKRPPMFPKMGPYRNRCPVVVPYVNTLGTRCG